MRILVTGGTGFIGAHILNQLASAGHTVGCFDIAEPTPIAEEADGVTFFRGDITDPVEVGAVLAEFDPDRIVHLASLLGRGSQRNPRQAMAVNVDGTVTLLELADSHDIDRIVVASSVSSYGDVPDDHDRLTETVVQQPDNVYGLTKYAVERLGAAYQDQERIEFAAIQPVHGLGPDRVRGNVEDAFIIKAAVSGEQLTVPPVEQPVEIVYVEDTARAFVDATLSETLSHHRYLVGSGERATLVDIVEMVRDTVPDANLTIGTERGADELTAHPSSDTARIREDLGWEPTHTVRESVEAYVDWLQNNPELWSFDASDAPWTDE